MHLSNRPDHAALRFVGRADDRPDRVVARLQASDGDRGRGDEGALHLTTGDTVIAEGRFAGRHVGEFEGLAPTGREVDFRFVVVVGLRDGLMAGERFYYDRATLWRQDADFKGMRGVRFVAP